LAALIQNLLMLALGKCRTSITSMYSLGADQIFFLGIETRYPRAVCDGA